MNDTLTPITQSRRATFVPLEHVYLWQVISRDPDDDEDIDGELVSEQAEGWLVRLAGDEHPTWFPARTPRGVTVWRRWYPKLRVIR
jgi:hypothetical protein